MTALLLQVCSRVVRSGMRVVRLVQLPGVGCLGQSALMVRDVVARLLLILERGVSDRWVEEVGRFGR